MIISVNVTTTVTKQITRTDRDLLNILPLAVTVSQPPTNETVYLSRLSRVFNNLSTVNIIASKELESGGGSRHSPLPKNWGFKPLTRESGDVTIIQESKVSEYQETSTTHEVYARAQNKRLRS